MKKLIIAAAVAAGMSSTAFAADLDTEVVDPVFGWGGFYAGVQIGYGRGETDWTYTGGAEVDSDPKGVFGGAHVGVNFQNGNLVAGLELEYNFGSIDASDPCPNPAFACESEIDSFGSVRGRVGYANDDWLFYGLGGVAFAQIEAQTVSGAGVTAGSKESYTGWTVGAGVEKAFQDSNWSWRAEYAYYDFGSDTHEVDAGLMVDFEPKLHTFRIAVTRRF